MNKKLNEISILFGVTIGVLMVLAYPIIYAQLYKFKLRNEDPCSCPSNFSLLISDLSLPKYMPPTPSNVIQFVSQFLEQKHGIADISYMVPCYDISEFKTLGDSIKLKLYHHLISRNLEQHYARCNMIEDQITMQQE